MKNIFFTKEKLTKLKVKTPFFVFSKNALIANVKEYRKHLPQNTEICYAMKSNSESHVLKVLNQKKISFEVASNGELDLLKKINVSPDRIVYGTSVRAESQIDDFVKYGVDRFAFDSEEELVKIAKYSPKARVYVRVLVNDRSNSVFHMSEKFGVLLNDSIYLLVKAKELGLEPYGISFNVGSQARSEFAWARGITDVAHAMVWLLDKDIKIQTVNIGGGFPYSYKGSDKIPSISKIGEHILKATQKLPYEVKFLAEPGRGLVANTYVLVVSIIAKNKRTNGHWLFVDAGVYNALLEAMAYQGSIRYHISPLREYHSDIKQRFIITGPTGDNLDVIDGNATLPENINVGDKLVVYDTGAYSFTLATQFNGFPVPRTIEL